MKLKRIERFEKLGFGMFIHFGLFSLMEKGEWVFATDIVDMAEYKKLMSYFTAENLDFDKICQTAQSAGMKYITLTTRHHDGFSLYDTKGLNNYDSLHCACKRDFVKEFVNACNKYDIKPFLYHTIIDWSHPDFPSNSKAYFDYLNKSIEILCTNYGEIGGFWFDGFWFEHEDFSAYEDELYKLIRKYQPETIIINNTGLNERGIVSHYEIDSVTFERGKPFIIDQERKYRTGEMCQVLNGHWGCAINDINYKSVAQILEDLTCCRRFDANYLLNVGPKADGSLKKIEEGFLEELAVWNKYNGVAIEGCSCRIISDKEHVFLLKNGREYYMIAKGLDMILDKNVSIEKQKNSFYKVKLSGFDSKVVRINWLDNNESLTFTQNGEDVFVQLTPFKYGFDLAVRVARIELE